MRKRRRGTHAGKVGKLFQATRGAMENEETFHLGPIGMLLVPFVLLCSPEAVWLQASVRSGRR